MAVLESLGRLVDFLGGVGPVLFGIALLLVAPYVDRLLVRRKRVSFRVLYNSKIGLGPERLGDGGDPTESGPPTLRQVARLLDRMSIVVIRIRNSGSYDIDPDDFDRPLSFTFGGRVVWNARVSEASTDELRRQLRESLRFFPDEDKPARDGLVTVRRRLSDRMARWFGAPQGPDVPEPAWHGVRLAGLRLKRGEKAKLVVVLREPGPGHGDLTKVVEQSGKLKDAGMIQDEKQRHRVTLPRVSAALVILLSTVLVLSRLSEPPDRGIACAPGELRVEGSTVIMPTIRAIADEYENACGTTITTSASGSIAGVRNLIETPAADVVAVSDGRSAYHDRLHGEKLAIVVYHVVVNSGVGLTTLSLDDLRKINDGTWTDWNQLREDKTSLPIRIIGRGQSSGTRQLFEHEVLGTGENVLSSDECVERDRNPAAPVIRCERDDNPEIIRKISTIPGAIGYADALSIDAERRAGGITALTLDGKAFDLATAGESGYPFWTVEYVYTKDRPRPGSPAAGFLRFLRSHELAQVRLTGAGLTPCLTKEGVEEVCDLR
ncbi:substrate-binding domain-containing protein [Nonomuraea sp. K274]|uniref:Substrate-binding domain-containing protein n=1 Tax=Nonomuraea cypriaca TaxID=1187855 RepID=A0A931F1V6_9ACTN|nr:substrate-binding domain-containing protein [Nonomuraea cypriaca]MBF8187898.1 substrate-binding domain-containing protein [Nonomuraea cypriaca]